MVFGEPSARLRLASHSGATPLAVASRHNSQPMNRPTSSVASDAPRWPRNEAEALEAWEAARLVGKAAKAAAYRDPALLAQQALVLLICLLKCAAVALGVAIPLAALGLQSKLALVLGVGMVPPALVVFLDLFWTNLFAQQGAMAFDAEISRRRAAALNESQQPGD